MKMTLEKAQGVPLDRASVRTLRIRLRVQYVPGMTLEDEEEAHRQKGETYRVLNQYLVKFAHSKAQPQGLFQKGGTRCLCGHTLDGFFGTFSWGLAHGEGYCGFCDWPARAFHEIKDPDTGEGIATIRTPLPYHPDVVMEAHARRQGAS